MIRLQGNVEEGWLEIYGWLCFVVCICSSVLSVDLWLIACIFFFFCMSCRWFTYLNSVFKKGGWSPEEDMLLCEVDDDMNVC